VDCWICGAPNAGTREHRTKASDLRALFGKPTQGNPLYFHTDKRRNCRVGSLKADILKYEHRICARCNNERTQPHDLAWALFPETLRSGEIPLVVYAIPGEKRDGLLRAWHSRMGAKRLTLTGFGG